MLGLTQRANVELFIGKNIGALEEILDQTAQEYLAMQKEKGKYDFGQNLTLGGLKNLAEEVIRDTNDFLGVSHTPPKNSIMVYLPREIKINDVAKYALGASAFAALVKSFDGFTRSDLQTAAIVGLLFGIGTLVYMKYPYPSFSDFDVQEKFMTICEKKEVGGVDGIANAYVHFLQDSFTDLPFQRNPIAEGHASGVARAVASIFAQRYYNPAYLFYPTQYAAEELKDSYLFICGKNGRNPRESLASLPIPNVGGLVHRALTHHYSIGTAAMSIAQSQHGNGVYRRVMQNDFSFLRV